MKIIAALDGTETSQVVFREALRLARSKNDELILMAVTNAPSPSVSHPEPLQKQPHVEGRTKEVRQPTRIVGLSEAKAYDPSGVQVRLLTEYANQCQKLNLRHRVVLGVSQNVGQLLCQAVLDKDADYLVLGRSRTSSSSNRYVTSKFCMENALCNVVLVKDLRPIVLHDVTVEQVVQATEIERKRRIQEEGLEEEFSDLNAIREVEENERRRRVKELYGEEGLQMLEKEKEGPKTLKEVKAEFESKEQTQKLLVEEKKKSWKLIDQAEEEERSRRIREEEELDRREKIERELAGRAAVHAQEQERERRLKEIKEEERIQEIKKKAEWDVIKRLEEEERERRMVEGPKLIDRDLEIELLGVTSSH